MVSNRPTIAHLLPNLARAGAERLATELARQLEHRYRFLFVCLDGAGPVGQTFRARGFDVVDLPCRAGDDRSIARHLRRLVRQYGVALLHAHQYVPFFYAATSRRLFAGRRGKPPILFTEHGRPFAEHRSFRRRLANKLLLTRRDRVTAIGQFAKQDLVESEGIPARRIEVIYNGIDPSAFRSAAAHGDPGQVAATRQQVRAELGLAPDAPLILQVAKLQPDKGHVTAVAAMAHVVEQLPEAVLVMVGDGIEKRRVKAKANEFGLSRNVRMVGVRPDVPRFMVAADVCMLSSLDEGVSAALLGAMALGKPIVTTDVGGNSEVVDHGKNGLLCRSNDSRQIAASLTALLRNPQMQSRMGRAGRDRLQRLFTRDRMHAGYTQIYHQMLSRKHCNS